jgi:ATP-binding cassette subfamily B protein
MKKHSFRTLLSRLSDSAKPFRKSLAIVLACIIGMHVTWTATSVCISEIVDYAAKHGIDKPETTRFSITLVVIAFVLTAFRIVLIKYKNNIEIKELEIQIANNLNRKSLEKFFTFSNGQHLNEHSGVKQNIVTNGVNAIRNQISALLYRFFPAFASYLISIGILFYCHWIIGVLFVLNTAVYLYMMYRHNNKLVPGIHSVRDQDIVNNKFRTEMFRFVSVVKNETQEKRSLKELDSHQNDLQEKYANTWLAGAQRMMNIRWVTNGIRYAVLLGIVYYFAQGKISAGMLFLAFTYSTDCINSLWDITDIHKQYLVDKSTIDKYFDVMEIEPDVRVVENPIPVPNIRGHIEFRGVSFSYPMRQGGDGVVSKTSEPVLQSVSFTISPGERVGIVGESGSGKSTIANLLRRAFDPTKGQILIDGNDLRLLDLRQYLQNIGSVEQEVCLFDRSVRDNILFGLNGKAQFVTDQQLLDVARLSRIDCFLPKLGHGFDTFVGEKGIKLSGGERQRIGIARALIKNPSILIFDEATSSLDSISEEIVQSSINQVSKGKTTIIIAHRLSTVLSCDKIIVLKNGQVLGCGTHSELLVSCEYYKELVSNQMILA